MKRTSDRLATFINKKLTQAATVFEPQTSAPVPAPAAQQDPPQQGQPLWNSISSEPVWGEKQYYGSVGAGARPGQSTPGLSDPHLGSTSHDGYGNYGTGTGTGTGTGGMATHGVGCGNGGEAFHNGHGMSSAPSHPPQPPVPPVPPSLSETFHDGRVNSSSTHSTQPPLPPMSTDGYYRSPGTSCSTPHSMPRPVPPPSQSFHKAHTTPSTTTPQSQPPVPPPVTNAALDSPYPPSSFSHESTKQDSRFPQTPMSMPSNVSLHSTQSSYTAPSPYILPPSTCNNPPSLYPQPPDQLSYYQRKTYSTPEPPCTPSDPSKFHSFQSLPLSTTPSSTSFAPKSAIPPLHQLIQRRITQAKSGFPHAVIPLSRQLDASNDADLELWRHQLTTQSALSHQPTGMQTLPDANIFYLGLTDANFTTVEWARLKRVLTYLSAHHNRLHLALPPPSHTRLLACTTFPVISLSPLAATLSAAEPWRFLEEVSGAWGGGVIYACETRGASVTGVRETLRYYSRCELPVEKCMKQALRNVLFGAVTPEPEILEIAKWTFRKGLAVGDNWREALIHGVGGELLPPRGVWLDGSRTVDGCWKGGVEGVEVRKCVRVSARDQEFFFVRFGDEKEGVWVLVGDVGKRVWSKIVCGEESVRDMRDFDAWIGRVIDGMVGGVEILSVRSCDVKDVGLV